MQARVLVGFHRRSSGSRPQETGAYPQKRSPEQREGPDVLDARLPGVLGRCSRVNGGNACRHGFRSTVPRRTVQLELPMPPQNHTVAYQRAAPPADHHYPHPGEQRPAGKEHAPNHDKPPGVRLSTSGTAPPVAGARLGLDRQSHARKMRNNR